MSLPNDLKDYKAPLGAFQLIEEGAAGVVLLCMVAFLFFMWPCV